MHSTDEIVALIRNGYTLVSKFELTKKHWQNDRKLCAKPRQTPPESKITTGQQLFLSNFMHSWLVIQFRLIKNNVVLNWNPKWPSCACSSETKQMSLRFKIVWPAVASRLGVKNFFYYTIILLSADLKFSSTNVWAIGVTRDYIGSKSKFTKYCKICKREFHCNSREAPSVASRRLLLAASVSNSRLQI